MNHVLSVLSVYMSTNAFHCDLYIPKLDTSTVLVLVNTIYLYMYTELSLYAFCFQQQDIS